MFRNGVSSIHGNFKAGKPCCLEQKKDGPNVWSPERRCVQEIRNQLETAGWVWICGDVFRELLIWRGASLEDLAAIESGGIHANVSRDLEPAMHFRQAAIHRVILDAGNRESAPMPANCQAVTQLATEEIAEFEGATVNFKRSGTRYWAMPPKAYADSSVAMAFGRLHNLLHPDTHHPQANINHLSKLVINDQALLRINKDSGGAEPSPEGIHQDGSEITSVTMIDRHNVASGGESRLWSLAQPPGNYDSDTFGELNDTPRITTPKGFDWENCLLNQALTSPWDTVYFNDREVKHEARNFQCSGPDGHRSVIVNFVQKPLLDGSDKVRIGDVDCSLY